MFKIFPDLEGYENLATTAKTIPAKLKDLNLDTVESTQEILIELNDSDPLYGVYKIIIYGKSTTADVSGWTVRHFFIATGKRVEGCMLPVIRYILKISYFPATARYYKILSQKNIYREKGSRAMLP